VNLSQEVRASKACLEILADPSWKIQFGIEQKLFDKSNKRMLFQISLFVNGRTSLEI
jgi:hypothetical protein